MFRYIFKGTNIIVKIYSGRQYAEEKKQQIIYEHHNSPLGGHAGISRTIKRLKLNHNWHNIKKDVKRYIKSCELCQKNKSHTKTKQPMLITSTVLKPFERICQDIVGPLPKTIMGNTHILTLQDELSRYALAIALSSTDAPTVAQAFVECYVCTYGIPKSILTDCGTNFLSDVFKGMCKLLDIKKVQTTAWHPQTNGFLERSHKTLKTYLRSFVDKDSNWDKLLCYATFCYNTTVHTSTDFTPYELVFGTKPNIPSAFNKDPEPQYNYDNYVFDLKRDKVLIREHNKKNALSLNWQGPYDVLIKQHIFLKELSTVIGREQHNSAALYPDEIPNCLLTHTELANRNLLQSFSTEGILNMTRILNHFTHDMTKNQRSLTKPLCLKIQYAVMDFEFTNLGRDNLILISGAIKGRHSPDLVTKLEGRALVLRENRVVTPDEWKDMVHHLIRIFKKKPQYLYPILAQIYDSDVSTKPNLTKNQILDLLKPYDAIILWEGSTDIKILKTLGAPHIALSMRGWDMDFNGRFFLQLLYDKLVIVSHFIGEIQKNGHALKLSETTVRYYIM
ncbi:Uncharacterized protein FWK35_00035164 [Aphis craccivora]|uniref:RNA-directed DNA polymerase n=1 Tax=Aphis craccivora TaxID=307492 RepID=A0A6G0Y5S0_APHCR|nr:Uncharacterized protein FWK35_00035164 [Aphis craccivora]